MSAETYAAVDAATLGGKLAALATIRERLGGKPADWRIREVGDGNLNLVFIVEGEAGGVVVKQALPYVRMVGDSWPLPLARRVCPDRSAHCIRTTTARAAAARNRRPSAHRAGPA